MKKLRMLWVLLAVLLAAVLFIGCPPGGSEEEEEEGLQDVNLTDWTLVYLPLDETTDLNRAINGFALHAGPFDSAVDVEIKRIFVNTVKSASGDGYALVFDFSLGNTESDFAVEGNFYWTDFGDKVNDGVYKLAAAADAYVGGGAFGSPAAYDKSSNYWGFEIRSTAGLGNIRFVLNEGETQVFGDDGTKGPALRLIDVLELAN